VTGNPLQRFVSYTAQFQALAKQWNIHVFGDLFTNLNVLHYQLAVLEQNQVTTSSHLDIVQE
jgi:hypothetical protein